MTRDIFFKKYVFVDLREREREGNISDERESLMGCLLRRDWGSTAPRVLGGAHPLSHGRGKGRASHLPQNESFLSQRERETKSLLKST